MSRKIGIMLLSFLLLLTVVSAGCAPSASAKDLAALQSQVNSLQQSLAWTQQQLLAAENSVRQAQQKSIQLQSKVELAVSECAESCDDSYSTGTCSSDSNECYTYNSTCDSNYCNSCYDRWGNRRDNIIKRYFG